MHLCQKKNQGDNIFINQEEINNLRTAAQNWFTHRTSAELQPQTLPEDEHGQGAWEGYFVLILNNILSGVGGDGWCYYILPPTYFTSLLKIGKFGLHVINTNSEMQNQFRVAIDHKCKAQAKWKRRHCCMQNTLPAQAIYPKLQPSSKNDIYNNIYFHLYSSQLKLTYLRKFHHSK